MEKILIKNIQAIVTVDNQDRVLYHENILVEGQTIRYIGPEEKEADRVIDGSHCFAYPGLVNTTCIRHLPATCLRSRRWSCSPGW